MSTEAYYDLWNEAWEAKWRLFEVYNDLRKLPWRERWVRRREVRAARKAWWEADQRYDKIDALGVHSHGTTPLRKIKRWPIRFGGHSDG